LLRIVKFAPNIFTLSNLSCGVIALTFIVNHLPVISTLFVLLSTLFDFLDGRVARSLKVTSEFGVELDSLADVVSFGVVPALAVYEAVPYHVASIIALILFPIAGALRLARFNTRPTIGFFEGLPIPAAGLILCFFLWFPVSYVLLPFIAIILSFLMISKLRVKKF
jgi:CDP-diacylglycerol---serine O-phosphatidyltransferase